MRLKEKSEMRYASRFTILHHVHREFYSLHYCSVCVSLYVLDFLQQDESYISIETGTERPLLLYTRYGIIYERGKYKTILECEPTTWSHVLRFYLGVVPLNTNKMSYLLSRRSDQSWQPVLRSWNRRKRDNSGSSLFVGPAVGGDLNLRQQHGGTCEVHFAIYFGVQ